MYILPLEPVCCPIVAMPPEVIHGNDPMRSTGIPEVLDLGLLECPQDFLHLIYKCVLESPQDFSHLIYECVLSLYPFLVHLESFVMFSKALLVSFLPNFEAFKVGFIAWALVNNGHSWASFPYPQPWGWWLRLLLLGQWLRAPHRNHGDEHHGLLYL